MTGLPKRIPAFAPRLAMLCAALLAMPAATAAQSVTDDAYSGPYAGASWSLKKVSNGAGTCMMIVNHGAMGLDAAGTNIVMERDGSGGVTMIDWAGGCDPDGLISGRGTLFIDLDETGSYLSKRFIGTADRGVLNGPVDYNPYYDIELDDYGELDPDQPVTFVNGCNNWNGKRPNGCDARRADRLRSDYMASRGAPATKPVAAKPAAPKPVAAKPAGPVAVAIPPSETNTLNDQQNAAAAAWLKADTEAKRVQAQKVADFERKQAEFNRQQTEYARQQEEYKAALAAQQAEVARIAKANADAQACYAGDKSRCNQAN